MSVVLFQRQDRLRSRVPIVETPLIIGVAPSAGLVVGGPDVEPEHAKLRYRNGEYLLSARGEAPLFVNGERVPLMALRDGDEVAFVDPAQPLVERLVFRNWLEGSFVPPGISLAEVWWGLPAAADPALGPERFGAGVVLGDRPLARCRRVEVGARKTALVVKTMPGVRDGATGDRLMLTLARAAGAAHPALARIVDGGLGLADGTRFGWMATRWVDGLAAGEAIAAGGLQVPRVVPVLRDLAAALAHLHARRLVHRDVAPGNVVLREDGGATLIDFGQMLPLGGAGAPDSPAVIGTPGYVAPEEVVAGGGAITPAVDVYGLGAVGYALLTGQPPSGGGDVLETLSQATRPAPSPRHLGIRVPDALETILMQALAADPAARPPIATVLSMLAMADAELRI